MQTLTVGQRIRQLREAKVWTQQDLAHHSGLTYKTISVAENDGGVKRKTLDQIAVALGTTLDALEAPSEVAS